MLGFSHFYRLNTLILGQFPCFSGIFHIKPFDRPIFLNYPENLQLWSPSEGVTFADYAYLYQLNTETWTIGEALQQIHMVSVGGMAGMMGVHFRYGANVYVADDGTLTLSATERNAVLGSSLATNDWIPAIVN